MARLPWFVIGLLELVPMSWAQSLSGSFGSSPDTTHADAPTMRDRAMVAFEDRAHRFLDDHANATASRRGLDRDALEALLDERLEDLEHALEVGFDPRRLDGLLTEAEATDVIGDETSSAWASFEEAVEARVIGKAPPPKPSDFDTASDHAWAMACYTLVERNGLREYLLLAVALAAGVLLAWFCSRALTALRSTFQDRGEDEPEDLPTHVVFEGFGESSLDLLVQYAVAPGEYWEALERGSDLHLEILDRFNEAGIAFAYPTITSVVETDDARLPDLGLATAEA